MSRVIKLDMDAVGEIYRLYRNDLCLHTLLYHDVFIEPSYTLLYLKTDRRSIEGYLLLFSPPEAIAKRELWVVVWGDSAELRGLLPTRRKKLRILFLEASRGTIESYLSMLREDGSFSAKNMLLMERKTGGEDYSSIRGLELAKNVERVGEESKILEIAEIYRSVGWVERALTLRSQVKRLPTFILRSPEGIGVATAYLCAYAPLSWMICGVAVHEAYRGRGYAVSLLGFIHSLAWLTGVEKTCLLVEESNNPALKLYKSAGYYVKTSVLFVFYSPRSY